MWIEDKWDFSQTYPIIRLSLDAIGHEIGLEKALLNALQAVASNFDILLENTHQGLAFNELIEKLAKKTDKQVVILIDEYDKPIIDFLDPFNLEAAQKQRDILKSFFAILKNASKHIRFLLITGISKFARISIFSELNHLFDLTLHPEYAAMCGYTQAELEHYFQHFLAEMPIETLSKMKKWYNGYSWDGNTFVYNPFSVLNFFSEKQYRNFWFTTGTPTFLVKVLRERFEYHLEETEVNDTILDSFILDKIDNLNITSLLLQTGYLTIKEKTEYGSFVLDYPNEEVRKSFGHFLLTAFTNINISNAYGAIISAALDRHDLGRVMQVLNDLIQAVPDQNYIQNQEKFVHAIVHLIFTMIGTDVRSEVHTSTGRIDTIIVAKDRIYLFEFKMTGTPDEAIQCIEDRNYAAHLRHRNLPIIGVGVVFSLEKKGINAWKDNVL